MKDDRFVRALRRATLAALLVASPMSLAGPVPPEATTPPPVPPAADGVGWKDAALFAGGAATAFLAHEAGHLTTNLALGNSPRIAPVKFLGFVPFFAVSPDIDCFGDRCTRRDGSTFGPGRRGLMLILLAGFDVQHVTDEVLLTRDPALRLHRAPFRTGMLAFNTLTSVGYAVANFLGAEPVEGDLHGAIVDTGASRALTTGLLLGVAGLDVARWAFPDVQWLSWASRGAKVAFLGLPLSI